MKRPPLVFALLAGLLLCGAPPAAGQSPKRFQSLATVLAEYDDNVYKTVSDEESDFLARLYFDARLAYAVTPRNRLDAAYTLGAKKFAEKTDEDTLINQLALRYSNTGITNTYLGGETTLKFRNIRDEEEDYNKLIARAFAGRYFAKGVSGEIFGAYTRFDFRTYDFYDYWTQSFGAEVKKAFSHAASMGFHYIFEDKHFPFRAYENLPTAEGEVFLRETSELRNDTAHEVGFFVAASSFVLVNFGYDLLMNDSNSYGDVYYNHRFRLAVSKAITDRLNAHLFAIANFRDSFQKVLIPHSFSVEEDDENFNQLVAKTAYRITGRFWLEARYSRFWSQYSVRDFNYTKNTYALGLSTSF
ncbi:MAG: hypothetical protein M5R36_01785 [Deltaproteobacteria bacterium]|nr:hypothetical protein [Deltaproteobacteria bacterium]